MMHRHVGPVTTVHSQHAEGKRMGARETTQTHQSHGHRNLCDFSQLTDLIRSIGKNSTAANVDHGLFRLHDLFSSLTNVLLATSDYRVVAAQVDFFRVFEFCFGYTHILWNID